MNNIIVNDPTASDKLSSVRGIGRYLQILKENFPDWSFTDTLLIKNSSLYSVFINPFFNFLKTPITIKRIAKKQIAVIHDLIPLKYPSHFPVGLKGQINIFLNKLALKNYDLIVTDSEASKKDIIKILKINENRIKVIYPCLPHSFINLKNKNLKLKIENSFCLYVGDATWNKNLVNLAKAIKIINVTCVFAGKVFEENNRQLADSQNNKWLSEYKEFLNETKNDKRFIFTGFLSDYELIKFYQQATINILPSRDEGFGFSYLEASSQGCPSILSDIPVFKEISQSQIKTLKNFSIFFNPENPNDIADKIGEIYFNKDLRDQLGKQAKKITKKFSSEKFKKNWQELL